MKSKFQKIIWTIGVIPRLGYGNFCYMVYYRLANKFGLRKSRFKFDENIHSDFFKGANGKKEIPEIFHSEILKRADEILEGKFKYYHHHIFDLDIIPDWFYDPFSKEKLNQETAEKHWLDINEFDLNTGDIKNLWELSRFDWLTDLSRAYAISLDKRYSVRINDLLNDWSKNNPYNKGVNWKCGQETSVRVMKLFNASLILQNINTISESLYDFVFLHLKRIEGNISYAIAQDNNHGTSEAAVLYIGSLWLLNQQNIKKDKSSVQILEKYRKKGRKKLENRIRKLILNDGTFSQKSVNYHRVAVDTLSFTLYGMQLYNEQSFSKDIFKRLETLGEWQYQMISNSAGNTPLLGANDGAMFENLHSVDYTDYRPSLQLYFALLKNEKAWNDLSVSEPLFWRNISLDSLTEKENKDLYSHIRDREFIQIVEGDIIVRIIATQDNFRPGNEVLHIDIWYKGENILTDSGTFSYNKENSQYFKSVLAHNTLQFDKDEPMPVISRFLNGKWIKVQHNDQIIKTGDTQLWEGKYKDYKGNYHKRLVEVNGSDNSIVITDDFQISPKNNSATLNLHINNKTNYSIQVKDEKGKDIQGNTKESPVSKYYIDIEYCQLNSYSQKAEKSKFKTVIKFN